MTERPVNTAGRADGSAVDVAVVPTDDAKSAMAFSTLAERTRVSGGAFVDVAVVGREETAAAAAGFESSDVVAVVVAVFLALSGTTTAAGAAAGAAATEAVSSFELLFAAAGDSVSLANSAPKSATLSSRVSTSSRPRSSSIFAAFGLAAFAAGSGSV